MSEWETKLTKALALIPSHQREEFSCLKEKITKDLRALECLKRHIKIIRVGNYEIMTMKSIDSQSNKSDFACIKKSLNTKED